MSPPKMILNVFVLTFMITTHGQIIYDGMSAQFRCKIWQNTYEVYNNLEAREESIKGYVINVQKMQKKWTEQEIYLRGKVSNLQENNNNILEQNQVLKEELSGLQEKHRNITELEKILQLEVSSLREKNANLTNKEQLLQKQTNSQHEKLQNCKGCPDVWVPLGNNCYSFSNTTATFSEAQRFCARDSAYILEDLGPKEKSFMKLRDFTNMWIGVTDNRQEGVYVYESTGSRVTNGDWVKGQPGGGRSENCAVALKDSDWQWHDYPCIHKFDYVCRKSKEGLV